MFAAKFSRPSFTIIVLLGKDGEKKAGYAQEEKSCPRAGALRRFYAQPGKACGAKAYF
jgi:hypothetical protein